MIHKYQLFGNNIVLDIYSGSVHVVSDAVYDLLGEYEFHPEEISDEIKQKYSESILSEAVAEIEELKKSGTLYSHDIYKPFRDAKTKTPPVKALCLHMAHDCDLRCRYCFAGTGAFHGVRSIMPLEVAKKAIDFVISHSQNRKNIEIDFFGGEPMLNFPVVKETVAYAREEGMKHGKHFRFTITTNGLLINEEQMKYVNENMDNVVLSCDGRKEVHDKNRKTVSGEGTYDKVIDKFIKIANDRKQMDYYIRGTFTKDNKDFTKDVLHLADLGFKQISVEPVTLDEKSPMAIGYEDLPEIFREYELLAEEIIRREKSGENRFNFFHFMIDLDNGPCALRRISGCGAGCEYAAVTPSGDIFPCHQFADEPEYKIGNVLDGTYEMPEQFRDRDIYTVKGCDSCFAKFYCSAGCSASSLKYEKDLYQPYDIACQMQKKRVECAIAIKAALAD